MFHGSIVALVTPFRCDQKIDEKALRYLVQWHIEKKTDAIVCCGTTGEASTLSEEEKLNIFDICIQEANGKIPIIAASGSNDTKKSVLLTQKAKEMGVSGCLAIVPYYNRPTQLGCLSHFRCIAEIGLPVIVYHHPKRTGTKLLPETFAQLEKIENIVAIKEASSDLSFIEKVQKKCSLPILSGDDILTYSLIEMGAVGVISVVANILPEKWKEFIVLCCKGERKQAFNLHKKFLDINESLSLETNPQGVKFALSLMKKCQLFLRLPLLEPTPFAREKIQQSLARLNLI